MQVWVAAGKRPALASHAESRLGLVDAHVVHTAACMHPSNATLYSGRYDRENDITDQGASK